MTSGGNVEHLEDREKDFRVKKDQKLEELKAWWWW
jgi:hypothetical protein